MQTGKITALYSRFSFDDGIDAESGSIEHQKALLRNYAESNGFTNLSYYADDGYTGTNFNRPDFQRMMNDIRNGLVGTVIVKDMSRLGRNYLMVGQYVEIEFPKHNIRFIAISDNVDSAKGMNDLLPIHNLMNECNRCQQCKLCDSFYVHSISPLHLFHHFLQIVLQAYWEGKQSVRHSISTLPFSHRSDRDTPHPSHKSDAPESE